MALIWPVPQPHLGTFLSLSNWGTSFFPPFFIMKECGLTFIFISHSLHPTRLLSLHVLLGLFVSCALLTRSCSLSLSLSLTLSDLEVGEWQPDSSSGATSRVLSYTIALNNPLGPKTAPVVETQVGPWQTPNPVFTFIIWPFGTQALLKADTPYLAWTGVQLSLSSNVVVSWGSLLKKLVLFLSLWWRCRETRQRTVKSWPTGRSSPDMTVTNGLPLKGIILFIVWYI